MAKTAELIFKIVPRRGMGSGSGDYHARRMTAPIGFLHFFHGVTTAGNLAALLCRPGRPDAGAVDTDALGAALRWEHSKLAR